MWLAAIVPADGESSHLVGQPLVGCRWRSELALAAAPSAAERGHIRRRRTRIVHSTELVVGRHFL